MWLNEIELNSETIKLLPLRYEHADDLVIASSDGNLSELWFTSIPNKDTITAFISQALNDQDKGLALPFVVVDKASNTIIGTTRFCHADVINKRIEIGHTWYAKSSQRSSVNTECKNLLLTYAFEQLNAIAVEFRTHWHNHKSRNAILRLGAKQDGVLRNHQKVSGTYRDTVVFSIIESEWPTVKMSLSFMLSQNRL